MSLNKADWSPTRVNGDGEEEVKLKEINFDWDERYIMAGYDETMEAGGTRLWVLYS